MGWSFRKSIQIGPIRLNLSKSGVGVSTGVDGARISTGPRGTHASVSKYGFRYSRRIAAPQYPAATNPSSGNVANSPAAAQPAAAGGQKSRPSRFGAVMAHLANQFSSSPARKMQSGQHFQDDLDTRMASFLATLIAHLTAKPPQPFDFATLAQTSGLNPDSAAQVAEKLFLNYARHALTDGILSDQERTKLQQLAGRLHIEEGRAIMLVRSSRK